MQDGDNTRFTDEQEQRLEKWILAGKPGEPHEWLGIPKEEYDRLREWAKARAREFAASPWVQQFLALSYARRIADTSRMDDDGAPPLPEWFRPTNGGRGEHLRGLR